jgi:hypothetical protein
MQHRLGESRQHLRSIIGCRDHGVDALGTKQCLIIDVHRDADDP